MESLLANNASTAPPESDAARAIVTLLATGVSLRDADGRNPLHLAAGSSCATLRLMLTAAAGPSATCLLARDAGGRLPLHVASMRGCAECATLLVDAAGRALADMLACRDAAGMTAMHYAACHAEVAAVLLHAGSSLTVAADGAGDTPLLTAVKLGGGGSVRAMVEAAVVRSESERSPGARQPLTWRQRLAALLPGRRMGRRPSPTTGAAALKQLLEHCDRAGLTAEQWVDPAVWYVLERREAVARAASIAAEAERVAAHWLRDAQPPGSDTRTHACAAAHTALSDMERIAQSTQSLAKTALPVPPLAYVPRELRAVQAVVAGPVGVGSAHSAGFEGLRAFAMTAALLPADAAVWQLVGPYTATARIAGRVPTCSYQHRAHDQIRTLLLDARRAAGLPLAVPPLPASLRAEVEAARSALAVQAAAAAARQEQLRETRAASSPPLTPVSPSEGLHHEAGQWQVASALSRRMRDAGGLLRESFLDDIEEEEEQEADVYGASEGEDGEDGQGVDLSGEADGSGGGYSTAEPMFASTRPSMRILAPGTSTALPDAIAALPVYPPITAAISTVSGSTISETPPPAAVVISPPAGSPVTLMPSPASAAPTASAAALSGDASQ